MGSRWFKGPLYQPGIRLRLMGPIMPLEKKEHLQNQKPFDMCIKKNRQVIGHYFHKT